MWLDETTSPSISSSSHDARLEAVVGAQQVGVALRLVAEAEVLADRDVRRAERADEHLVDELLRRARGERARRTGSRRAPARRATRSSCALRAGSVSSRGAAPGRMTVVGCGSNVSTVSAPRMTSRWPRCTPSNVPTATRRGRGWTSGRRVDLHARKPTTGLRPSARGWAIAIGPVVVEQQHVRARRPGASAPTATPCAARRASSPSRRTLGRIRAEDVGERHEPPGIGVGELERADRRAPQLLAVGVAEVGDEHAHVRPGRALDRERRAVALAPELLEAVDGDRALVEHDLLPRARQRVGAAAADLHRAVGVRALQQLAGRQHERVGRDPAGRP